MAVSEDKVRGCPVLVIPSGAKPGSPTSAGFAQVGVEERSREPALSLPKGTCFWPTAGIFVYVLKCPTQPKEG